MTLSEKLISILEQNDRTLSRTAKNSVVDTSSSTQKLPGLLSGPKLAEKLEANRDAVACFIEWQSRRRAVSDWEHALVLVTLGYLTGQGILPAGVFREWEYQPPGDKGKLHQIPPQDIPRAILSLGKRSSKMGAIRDSELRLAAVGGIEWDLVVGPLHPFYDGCGRVSRYFSATLCIWHQLPLVQHTSREQYFCNARKGKRAFQRYYCKQPRVILEIAE
jgi:hypothetical protein